MSRARDLADLGSSADAGGLTGRNMVINGAMAVSQRGDVTGKTATTYGGPDRWELGISGLGTHSISQSSTAPDGFSNSYKVDCTTADASPAAGDFLVASHKIEAQNLQHLQYGSSSAQKLTLSFYVRSNKTGTYVVELLEDDPSRHICTTYAISSADTWEFKKITFDGDTAGTGINDDNGVGLFINFWLGAGSNYTSGTLATAWQALDTADRVAGQTVNIADNTANEWLISGVQLEVGEQDTPFEHEDYGTTLRKCQRYYEEWGSTIYIGGNSFGITAYSYNSTHNSFWLPVQWKVKKRTDSPIVNFINNYAWQGSTSNSGSDSNGAWWYSTSTFNGSALGVDNSDKPVISVDAEL
jgi:hypothetical protein